MTDTSRAVVITGAAGDLGRELCGSFLADGFTVYAADRAAISRRPCLEAVVLDVTDRADVIALAERAGRERRLEAWINGAGAFLAVPGIVVTGTLSDYIGREWSAIIAYGFSIIGVVFALMITSPDQHWLLWLHACFFGLTWGARGPAITAKTADLFPGRQLGTILGVITIGSGIGSALGSWGAGWSFDLSGSYRHAFI